VPGNWPAWFGPGAAGKGPASRQAPRQRPSGVPPAPQRPDPPDPPHTHTYALTPDGTRIAIFYAKLHNRLLRPLAAAGQPQAPPALRQALTVIDRHVDDYIARARLKHAA
jgi:hypothetical protein